MGTPHRCPASMRQVRSAGPLIQWLDGMIDDFLAVDHWSFTGPCWDPVHGRCHGLHNENISPQRRSTLFIKVGLKVVRSGIDVGRNKSNPAGLTGNAVSPL